jgi:DNA-binding helix-hairpin-helix protein with protein kinase domain
VTTVGSGLTPTRRLGAGGEAEVYEVAERPHLALKRYHSATPERLAKLRVMVTGPPDGTDAGGHVAIAWPVEVVPGGFLMPKIDLAATVPLFQVYNPASRVQIAPAFTWRYLLRTARNLAAIVDSLHRAGYVIGDINESNLLVNKRALVTLVDCDSMQVCDPATGTVHRGGVGKPEFTAPELQGHDLSSIDRTPATDDFALAILVFQLLCEGVHPFGGIWRGAGDPPDVPARMRRGLFPYRRGGRLAPPPHALPLTALPPELRRLFRQAFVAGIRRPSARPTAGEWTAALERAEGDLRTCGRSAHHVHGAHLRRCPWCARIDAGLPDPFPGPTGRSTLERRPPPRRVRARRAVTAWALVRGRALRAAIARAAVRGGRWVWDRVGPPLGGAVPVVAAAVVAALLGPLVAGAVVLGALSPPWWTERARNAVRRSIDPATSGRWAGVRWALVASLLALYARHGTSWWPVP